MRTLALTRACTQLTSFFTVCFSYCTSVQIPGIYKKSSELLHHQLDLNVTTKIRVSDTAFKALTANTMHLSPTVPSLVSPGSTSILCR